MIVCMSRRICVGRNQTGGETIISDFWANPMRSRIKMQTLDLVEQSLGVQIHSPALPCS